MVSETFLKLFCGISVPCGAIWDQDPATIQENALDRMDKTIKLDFERFFNEVINRRREHF